MPNPGYHKTRPVQRGEKVAAIITINGVSDMTPSGRRKIAAWLRSSARFFEARNREFSNRTRFRYIYE